MITLNVALDMFIANCKGKGLSNRTVQSYQSFVGKFIKYTDKTHVSGLDYESVIKYAVNLNESPISKATHGTYMRHLKAFIHWLEDMEYIEKPFSKKIRVPRTPKKIVHIYDGSEIQIIFASIQIKPDWLRYRNSLIVALMLDSGLRQNEVCTILMKDISFRDFLIKVHGKGNKERLVPFGSLTAHYLTSYLKECPYKGECLFVSFTGEKLTGNAVKLLIQKISKIVPFDLSSHKLRHNFATNYCLDQYDKFGQIDILKLMTLMGHEDIKTTRKYLHLANQIIVSNSNVSHLDKIFVETV